MRHYFKTLATVALLASVSPAVWAQDLNGNDGSAAGGESGVERSIGPVTVDQIVGFDEGRSLVVIAVEEEGQDDSNNDDVGIEAMVDDQSAEFEAILDAIEENPVIYEQLRAEGYERGDILAVGIDGDSELTIRVHADSEADHEQSS